MNDQTLKYASYALVAYAIYSFSKKKNSNAILALAGAGLLKFQLELRGIGGQISQ